MIADDLINMIWEFAPKDQINDDSSLYHDLKIYGDDAEDFLTKYSEIFNVSLSNFRFDDYFPSEGDPVLPALIRFLTRKKRKIYKRLTVKQLQEAIKNKELK